MPRSIMRDSPDSGKRGRDFLNTRIGNKNMQTFTRKKGKRWCVRRAVGYPADLAERGLYPKMPDFFFCFFSGWRVSSSARFFSSSSARSASSFLFSSACSARICRQTRASPRREPSDVALGGGPAHAADRGTLPCQPER